MTPEELTAIEATKRLKASYFRLVDTRQWAARRELFSEDVQARFDRGPIADDTPTASVSSIELIGVDAIVEHARHHLRDCVSVHHGHTPEIDLISSQEAKGVWAMQDILIWPDGTVHGYGHYHERYRLGSQAWRIAALHLTRLHVSAAPQT